MATVTGILADYGLGFLTGKHPTLHFQPSGAAVGNTRIFAPAGVVVVPVSASGYFEAELQPTETIRPGVYYKVSVRWGSGEKALLPWRLRVPEAGGVLSDLLPVPADPAQVWIGTEPPANPTPDTWWMHPITGDLSEWSN